MTTDNRLIGESVRKEVGKIGSIEGIRGIAVLLVVFFHYRVLRSDDFSAFIGRMKPLDLIASNGHLGVDIFFILTGFLLILPWLKHRQLGREMPSARRYYARRVRRIVPAYYLQLAALFFVFTPILSKGLLWSPLWLTNLLSHVTFTHYLSPVTSASLSINGSLWSLSLEAQYYLILPLLALLYLRFGSAVLVALLAIAVLWRHLSNETMNGIVQYLTAMVRQWDVPESAIRHFLETQLPGYLGHFGLGIMCAQLFISNRDLIGHPHVKNGLFAAALGGIFFSVYLPSFVGMQYYHLFLVTPLCIGAVVHIATVRPPRFVRGLLVNRGAGFFGRISYSMFLYHMPLILLLNKYIRTKTALIFPLFFLLLTALSWLSYEKVEKRFMV